MFIGGIIGLGLMVAALWLWGESIALTAYTARPEVTLWAARSAAVAVAAMAQVALLTFVVRTAHTPRLKSDVLRIALTLVGGASLVSAAALGLAGR